jgi:uncharacterized protein (UPF0333 family)
MNPYKTNLPEGIIMKNRKLQKGQGLIEYLLLTAVVVVAIVAFATQLNTSKGKAVGVVDAKITAAASGISAPSGG